jgi:hypothetical protein
MNIAILDDSTQEWLTAAGAGLLTKVSASVGDATDPPDGSGGWVAVQVHTDDSPNPKPLRYVQQCGARITFHLIELNQHNQQRVQIRLAELKADMLWIDCSIDGNDRSEGGIAFAEQLVTAKIATEEEIFIVTNKANTNKIKQGDIPKFRGRFRASLKDKPEALGELIVQRLTSPSRPRIEITESINNEVHKSCVALDRFFHPTGAPNESKPKHEIVEACDRLIEQTALAEAQWLKMAIEDFAKENHLDDGIESTLTDYVVDTTKRAVMTAGTPDNQLLELVVAAARLGSDLKLKDVLFPRIDQREHKTFRFLTEEKCKQRGFTVIWENGLPENILSNPETEILLDAAVPLSWFQVFNQEWLGDLSETLGPTAPRQLRACCGRTKEPHHVFVMFWNPKPGFPSKQKIMDCANKILVAGARFSHAFIASACEGAEDRKALVEVRPNGVPRDIPSCKLHFGATQFDFSRWSEGSAYLFAAKALKN